MLKVFKFDFVFFDVKFVEDSFVIISYSILIIKVESSFVYVNLIFVMIEMDFELGVVDWLDMVKDEYYILVIDVKSSVWEVMVILYLF